MSDQLVNKNTTVALLAGAFLGAGIALLFAPQSGRRTRRDIRHFAEKVGNKADAARIELTHSIDGIIGDVEEKLRDGLTRGVDWTDTRIAELRQSLDSIRKTVAGEIDKIQSF
jgi:gas vesicle protein